MTETKTETFETLADWLRPAAADWAWGDCQRLATPAEMVDADNRCAECGDKLIDKYGDIRPGTVIGYRFGPDTMWVWTKPACRDCETAHAIADGYTR